MKLPQLSLRMKRLVSLLIGAVSLGLLAACAASPKEPATAWSTAEVEVRDVYPTVAQSSGYREMYVQTRITNPTTDKSMPLNARSWGLRLANDEFYFSRTSSDVSVNESTCATDELAPGRTATCNLFFGFGKVVSKNEVLPARVSYSPAGWSSGADVGEEWAAMW